MKKPISRPMHGLITDYSDAAMISTAPETISFKDEKTATTLCRALAGGILTSSLLTRAEWDAVPAISFKTHLFLDVANQFMWRGYQQQLREMGVASIVPLLLPEFLTGKTRTERRELVTEITNQILMASVNGAIGGAGIGDAPGFAPDSAGNRRPDADFIRRRRFAYADRNGADARYDDSVFGTQYHQRRVARRDS